MEWCAATQHTKGEHVQHCIYLFIFFLLIHGFTYILAATIMLASSLISILIFSHLIKKYIYICRSSNSQRKRKTQLTSSGRIPLRKPNKKWSKKKFYHGKGNKYLIHLLFIQKLWFIHHLIFFFVPQIICP